MNDTFPPLTKRIPQTVDELWAGTDPRLEPLDTEILHSWEEEGITFRVLRYRLAVFKGEKAMMAGIYGFPTDASEPCPGLIQMHGGGQFAHHNAVRTNARRGYATLSIAWAGRIDAPGYFVDENVERLFWEGQIEHPAYKRSTDYGLLEGYHAPSRFGDGHTCEPKDWNLDDVHSPRNNFWFLWLLAARRGLTFLEQQAEVDADRLGAYGHSMGGKLTVLVAGIDQRVKAAVPSCGGISNRVDPDDLYLRTLGDLAYLERIHCPILFLSPANDFHGRINHLVSALEEIQTDQWRLTCAPHHNHQDTAPYEVSTQLWMDQYLKGNFTWPATPQTHLALNRGDGVPVMTVHPDASMRIRSVDVYYTQQGEPLPNGDNRDNAGIRFWHYAATVCDGAGWKAELPLTSIDRSLWAYANVMYELPEPVSGAGFYYVDYTTDCFNVTSRIHLVDAADLQIGGVRATRKPSLLIELFEGEWQKEWFSYCPHLWGRHTHKVYDPVWAAPEQAVLAIDVRSEAPNKLVIGLGDYAAEVALTGGEEWQSVCLEPSDFANAAGEPRADWSDLTELRLLNKETLRRRQDGEEFTLALGGDWQGPDPAFRNLRWERDRS